MKDERTYRLSILQCFLDNSPLVSRIENSRRRYDPSVVSLVVSWKECDQIIHDLKEQDVVSKFYSKRCLDVDLWYLTRDINLIRGIDRTNISLENIEHKLLFQIVFQSLIDLQIARPCDCKAWRQDLSPDFKSCTENEHICWNDAESYLLSVDPTMESCIGLGDGFISSTVANIKKNRIFKIPFFFQSEFICRPE